METLQARVGSSLNIGSDSPIAVQTMCNTRTGDEEATLAQCVKMAAAGAELIRITVPAMQDVQHIGNIRSRLRAMGVGTPICADIHFSSETAIAVAPLVDKVRINPGNFHPDHNKAREQFARFLGVCGENGTAVRVGLNHGSLGRYITELYGNTPLAMAKAAMEWLQMCVDAGFFNALVSLKSSNTVVMVEAYRLLAGMMQEEGHVFPLHLGVTEAGNGDSGRIKSAVGISTLLSEGIGNTIRVSLTEDPLAEIPVARHISDRYSRGKASSVENVTWRGKTAYAKYNAPSREILMLDAACDFGKALLDREADEVKFSGSYMLDGEKVNISANGFADYLEDELMQAARRRFYKPEYIACPGCGRTMYNLQEAFEKVKARTSHLNGMVIAVMGCIVNGPGEMADADWGYVGEGNGKVSIYRRREAVLRHVPEEEAADRLLELIEAGQ